MNNWIIFALGIIIGMGLGIVYAIEKHLADRLHKVTTTYKINISLED